MQCDEQRKMLVLNGCTLRHCWGRMKVSDSSLGLFDTPKLSHISSFCLEHHVGVVDFRVDTNGIFTWAYVPPFLVRGNVIVVKCVWVLQLGCDYLNNVPIEDPLNNKLWCLAFLLFHPCKQHSYADQALLPPIACLECCPWLQD